MRRLGSRVEDKSIRAQIEAVEEDIGKSVMEEGEIAPGGKDYPHASEHWAMEAARRIHDLQAKLGPLLWK